MRRHKHSAGLVAAFAVVPGVHGAAPPLAS